MSAKQAKPKTRKIVIRKLPFDLTEEAFLQFLKPFEHLVTFVYFVPGKAKTAAYTAVSARAYVTAKDMECVLRFHEQFSALSFQDIKGHDYKASVELAPFQKVSKPRRAKDSRQGTIAKDADFLEFCKQLESPPAPLPPADKQLELKEKEAKEQGAEKKQQPLAPIVEYLTDRKGYLARRGTDTQKQEPKAKDSRKEKEKKKKGKDADSKSSKSEKSKKGDSKSESKQGGKQTSKPGQSDKTSAEAASTASSQQPPKQYRIQQRPQSLSQAHTPSSSSSSQQQQQQATPAATPSTRKAPQRGGGGSARGGAAETAERPAQPQTQNQTQPQSQRKPTGRPVGRFVAIKELEKLKSSKEAELRQQGAPISTPSAQSSANVSGNAHEGPAKIRRSRWAAKPRETTSQPQPS